MAEEYGINTGPIHLISSVSGEGIVDVCPLYSWYHSSWDTEADLVDPLIIKSESFLPFSMKWSDFRRCSWPNMSVRNMDFVSNIDQRTLSDMFSELNEPYISKNAMPDIANRKTHLISFSHFVPRQELCPEKRFLLEPKLTKVIGSVPLEKQIRRLAPNLHIVCLL